MQLLCSEWRHLGHGGRLWHSAESKIACQIVNPLTKVLANGLSMQFYKT